jgi:predicted transcriptional regulator
MKPLKSLVESLPAINYTLIRDGLIILSCFIASAIVMIMGGANCYANLVNSGAFEGGMQWIAFTLSCLPAIGSFSIKFLSNLIPERFKTPYAITINGLSIVSLLAWAAFFALSFSNNTPINMESVTQEEPVSSFAIQYTLAQILAELFLAANLFQVADETVSKYLSERKIQNPDYVRVQEEYDTQSKIHAELLNQRNEKQGMLKKLEALKHAYISEQVASYFNIASQLKP